MTNSNSNSNSNSKESFESAMLELEEIVKVMESGNVNLNDMVSLYERASELYDYCNKELLHANTKIQQVKFNSEDVILEEYK